MNAPPPLGITASKQSYICNNQCQTSVSMSRPWDKASCNKTTKFKQKYRNQREAVFQAKDLKGNMHEV